MNAQAEQIRNELTDAFQANRIDARNLAIEVVDGQVSVEGTVPSQEQLQLVASLLSSRGIDSQHRHVKVAPAAAHP